MNLKGPAVSYETVLKWAKKAKSNCSNQGRYEAATLWGDAIEWLEYLNAENDQYKTNERD